MKFFIKEAREKAGLSQKELAELIGVAPNTMHGYESGKHDPKSDLLKKISAACHVSIDFLLGNSSRTDAIKPAWELSKDEVTSSNLVISSIGNPRNRSGYGGFSFLLEQFHFP